MKSILLILFLTIPAISDKAAFRLGEPLDPNNIENIDKVMEGAGAAKSGVQLLKAKDKKKAFKDKVKSGFNKYQQSKLALMSWINKINKKTLKVINVAQKRVNKWRTTAPKLRSFANSAGHFFGGGYEFTKSFRLSDLVDIDRKWSKEMEARLAYGYKQGSSFITYLNSRIDDPDILDDMHRIFCWDFRKEIEKRSPKDFIFDDKVSKSEKTVFYIRDASFESMNVVQHITHKMYGGSEDASELNAVQSDNRKIESQLYGKTADFTDQLSLNQDILNQQYKVEVYRSQLQDERAKLDLLWAKLSLRPKEKKELYLAKSMEEFKHMAGLKEKNWDAYMKSKGLK